MPAPVVLAHVAERGANAALGGDGVAAGREHLGDAGGFEAGLGHADRCPQAGAAGPDDDHVMDVVGDRITFAGHAQAPNIRLKTASTQASPSKIQPNITTTMLASLSHSV